jgi:hypothetical protein
MRVELASITCVRVRVDEGGSQMTMSTVLCVSNTACGNISARKVANDMLSLNARERTEVKHCQGTCEKLLFARRV